MAIFHVAFCMFTRGYRVYTRYIVNLQLGSKSSTGIPSTLACRALGCVTCSARSFYDHENAMENAMKTLTNAMKTLTGNADLPSGKLTV